MERQGSNWRLRSARGSITARRVLLCTNGYTDGLVPGLARSVVAVRSVQVATSLLSDNVRRSILPGGHSVSDSRRLLLYFRLDPEGRFVMGGRGDYSERGTLNQMEQLSKISIDLYPQLAQTDWAHAWGGFVGMTADHYPHLNRIGPNAVAALAYNGRGVAMATAMGRVLADWAREIPEAELDFPVTEPRAIPFRSL